MSGEDDFSSWGVAQKKKDPAIPIFRTEAVHMPAASEKAGRPIYEDREFVTIMIPGSRNAQANEPVNDGHKARWPEAYKAFREGKELPLEGTALANWPNSRMTRARVEELAYFNIRTVEHLAAVHDGQLQNLGMGARELREAAKTFLEIAAKGTAPIERLLARNQALEDENAALKRRLAEAQAQLQAKENA